MYEYLNDMTGNEALNALSQLFPKWGFVVVPVYSRSDRYFGRRHDDHDIERIGDTPAELAAEIEKADIELR
jgi:hypothetical protein